MVPLVLFSCSIAAPNLGLFQMSIVTMLAKNPLASTRHTQMDKSKAGFETMLLESTLAKIGALMQVGFGAAGAEIIGKNMGTGKLNPMVAGTKPA